MIMYSKQNSDKKNSTQVFYQFNSQNTGESTSTSQSIDRRVFYKSAFSKYELQQIRLFKIFMQKQNQQIYIDEITNQVLCRFLHSSRFDFRQTSRKIKSYIQWNHNPSIQTLTEKTKKIMKTGCIYSFGRDIKHRPVIYIKLSLINLSQNIVQNYYTVFNAVYLKVIQNMFIKGSIETFTIVVDADRALITNFPIDSILEVIKLLMDVFPMQLGLLIVINFSAIMNIVSTTIKAILKEDTQSRIIFLNPKQSHKIMNYIDSSNLQKKYKGSDSNFVNLLAGVNQNTYEKLNQESLNQSAYFSIIEQDQKHFKTVQIEAEDHSHSQMCKNCQIF